MGAVMISAGGVAALGFLSLMFAGIPSIANFGLACAKQFPDSCAELGRLIFRGEGVARNPKRALELWEAACSENSLVACAWAGQAYREGEGAAADLARAKERFERSCR